MYKLFFLLFLTINLPAKEPENSDAGWEIEKLNTGASVNYLTTFEKEVILEINKLRSSPVRYANEIIAPLGKNFKNKLFNYPNDKPLLTSEGISALNECVRDLKKYKAMQLVKPSSGLTHSALDHVKDQSRTGKTGHAGSDLSTMRARIERYGNWKCRIAENIGYGATSAQQLVVLLLIDDGVPSRGHRANFLNHEFSLVGVAEGRHPEFGTMCVMDFAASFENKQKR